MAAITIKGRIKSISPMQTINSGAKPFQFKELILDYEYESNAKYPQELNIQFAGKAMDNTDSSNPSDIVEIDINLKGKAHAVTGKVYNTLSGWKIRTIEKGAVTQFKEMPPSRHQTEADKWASTGESTIPESNDLPF